MPHSLCILCHIMLGRGQWTYQYPGLLWLEFLLQSSGRLNHTSGHAATHDTGNRRCTRTQHSATSTLTSYGAHMHFCDARFAVMHEYASHRHDLSPPPSCHCLPGPPVTHRRQHAEAVGTASRLVLHRSRLRVGHQRAYLIGDTTQGGGGGGDTLTRDQWRIQGGANPANAPPN